MILTWRLLVRALSPWESGNAGKNGLPEEKSTAAESCEQGNNCKVSTFRSTSNSDSGDWRPHLWASGMLSICTQASGLCSAFRERLASLYPAERQACDHSINLLYISNKWRANKFSTFLWSIWKLVTFWKYNSLPEKRNKRFWRLRVVHLVHTSICRWVVETI